MPLLSSTVKAAFEARKVSSSGGNYLNPSSVSEGDKLRITFLGDDSLAGWQCWATKADGAASLCGLPLSPHLLTSPPC